MQIPRLPLHTISPSQLLLRPSAYPLPAPQIAAAASARQRTREFAQTISSHRGPQRWKFTPQIQRPLAASFSRPHIRPLPRPPAHRSFNFLASAHVRTSQTYYPRDRHFYSTAATEEERVWPYLYRAFDKMPHLDPYFKEVDGLQGKFIDRLKSAVAIPSISSEDERRTDVVKMGEWLAEQIRAVGGTVELRQLGKQPGREHLDLPPVLLGRYGNDPNKKTILLYGHYDVQPAQKSDGWATDPFTLTMDDKGRMFGRGSTDDKGPVLGWINAIEAHQKAGVEVPVNLIMCFEGMEENGSEGLDNLIEEEAKKFFKDADVICISDNYWLGTEKPCLTYGVRGCNYYSIEVSGPGQDLHSGVYGGMTHEPMTDLIKIMGSFVDPDGKILIKGIDDLVAPLTDEEAALYPPIAFTMNDLHESLGSEVSIYDNKDDSLKHKMRYPSLSLHGIEGAFYTPGAKTVIPAKVIGKFSIRTVPNMEIDAVTQLVEKHVNEEFARLRSKNKMKFNVVHCGKWWVEDFNHPNYTAAAKAVERVYGVKPDMTREGGSIPVTLTFQAQLGKNVLLLPMGSSTDAAHSINEKLDKRNYIEGTKLLGAYLHYVAGELVHPSK